MTSIKTKLRQFVAALFTAFNKSRFRRILAGIFAALTMFLLAAPVAAQDEWFVDDDAAPGGNGLGWSTAFDNLQDALDEAEISGGSDLIKVAQGVYIPTVETDPGDPRSVTFSLNGSDFNNITIQGGYAGVNEPDPDVRDVDLYVTTLSGELGNPGEADNAYHVLKFFDVDSSVSIDGVTIRNALADGTNLFERSGAGFFSNSAEPLIRNCVIRDNEAQEFGGGAYALRKGPIFVLCTFRNNTAGNGGGALFQKGAPNGLPAVDLVLVNCEFWDNNGGDAGGGLAISNAILAPGTTYEITNCLFVGNDATLGGAAFFSSLTGGGGIITNCTFVDNPTGSAIYGGGALAPMTITNSILWFNEPNQVVNPSAEVNYTNIEGGWTGDGTGYIDVEPDFGPGSDNYRLFYDSAGIDAADNDAVPCDEFDVDDDGEDCDAPAQDTPDLDLTERRIDDPDTDDTGNGDPPLVDMGAYEFEPCPWDLDEGCFVGVGDLLILLADWGNPYGVQDLLDLLAAWGPCQCDPDADPLSLEEELADACLSPADWNAFVDKMQNGTQAEKDNYLCWMEHYLNDCSGCLCAHPPGTCPGADPFN